MLVYRYKAYVFVNRSGNKYDEFRKGLINKWGDGDDKYLSTLVEAHRRLETYVSLLPKANPKTAEEQQRGLNFNQDGKSEQLETPTARVSFKKTMKCFKCARDGHMTK